MSIFGNLSDLAHEIRSGFGTVLTILGSHLEATERARVDASAVCAGCGHARVDHVELVGECGRRVGPERVPCTCREFVGSVGAQWLTEFEEQRDSLEPADMCQFHGEWCAGEASWCTRQCSKCDEAVYWHRDVEAWFHCAGVLDRRPCPYGDGPVVEHSSAAVSAAADPSPTVPNAHSVVGDRPGSDSVILPTVEPGPQNLSAPRCKFTDTDSAGDAHWCDLELGHEVHHEATNDAGERMYATHRNYDGFGPVPLVVAGESPREESPDQPSLGVTFDDLAAHIMGDFTSGHEVDALTATYIDGLASLIASSLLADFNITKK